MKTSAARNIRTFEMDHHRHLDEFDDLVKQACRGDQHAIDAFATAVGPALLEETRCERGDLHREAERVLEEFVDQMLDCPSRFRPAHGSAMRWLCGEQQRRRQRAPGRATDTEDEDE